MNHEDNFVLLSAFESLWFKFKLTHYPIFRFSKVISTFK